jgi:hypothetical protein
MTGDTGSRSVYTYNGQNFAVPAQPAAPSQQVIMVTGITPIDFFSGSVILTTSPAQVIKVTLNNNVYVEQISINVIQANNANPSTVYFYLSYGQFSIGSASNFVATQTPINRPFTDPYLPLLLASQQIQVTAYYSGGSGASLVLGVIGFLATQSPT